MKIVVLANEDRQQQVFKKSHIEALRQYGKVVLNISKEGPDEKQAAAFFK